MNNSSDNPPSSSLDVDKLARHSHLASNQRPTVTNEEKKTIHEFFHVVQSVASVIYSRKKLPPTIDYNDLLSTGFDGLLKAIRKFDPQKNAQFKTYATIRVRGEMMDFIRKEWRLKFNHQYNEMMNAVRERVGHMLDTILSQSNNSLNAVNLMSSLTTSYVISLEYTLDTFGDSVKDDGINIEKEYEVNNEYHLLHNHVNRLNTREREFITMFYDNGLSQRHIAQKMNISEPTASRLHKKAIDNLRKMMTISHQD